MADIDVVGIAAGTYRLGSDDGVGFADDGEGPVRVVDLAAFQIATTHVTNRQFRAFVEATGHVTEAERFGTSLVFHTLVADRLRRTVRRCVAGTPWWLEVPGACWKWPFGRGSHLGGRLDHPVVHVSWNDARAFCAWAGARLPREDEWEAAARGGLAGATYPWGDVLHPEGRHMCNIWQGDFPDHDSGEDGWRGTSPCGSFPANGYGLYDMAGNVWQWCEDAFRAPRGGPAAPPAMSNGTERVLRGGSFLCHESYCSRYRVAARSRNTADSSTSNIGFRVARDLPGADAGRC